MVTYGLTECALGLNVTVVVGGETFTDAAEAFTLGCDGLPSTGDGLMGDDGVKGAPDGLVRDPDASDGMEPGPFSVVVVAAIVLLDYHLPADPREYSRRRVKTGENVSFPKSSSIRRTNPASDVTFGTALYQIIT
jgi:hypothetical protein